MGNNKKDGGDSNSNAPTESDFTNAMTMGHFQEMKSNAQVSAVANLAIRIKCAGLLAADSTYEDCVAEALNIMREAWKQINAPE